MGVDQRSHSTLEALLEARNLQEQMLDLLSLEKQKLHLFIYLEEFLFSLYIPTVIILMF